MKPTYYYTLYPDTFLWINETEGVMYNAKEHTYLSFDIHGLIKGNYIQSYSLTLVKI